MKIIKKTLLYIFTLAAAFSLTLLVRLTIRL